MKRMDDNALRETIEALLGQLQVRENRRDQIAREAELLCVAATFARVNDHPSAKEIGEKAAKRELDKLAKLSIALGRHIQSMHRDSLDAIEAQRRRFKERRRLPDSPLHPIFIVQELRELVNVAGWARGAVSKTPNSKTMHTKHGARELTRYAADMFERLTGRPVTRTSKLVPINAHQRGPKEDGEFQRFLAEVFKLFDVDAKAAGQIKQIKLLKAEKAQQKKAT
jgi:hypothetical protein